MGVFTLFSATYYKIYNSLTKRSRPKRGGKYGYFLSSDHIFHRLTQGGIYGYFHTIPYTPFSFLFQHFTTLQIYKNATFLAKKAVKSPSLPCYIFILLRK